MLIENFDYDEHFNILILFAGDKVQQRRLQRDQRRSADGRLHLREVHFRNEVSDPLVRTNYVNNISKIHVLFNDNPEAEWVLRFTIQI